MAVLIPFPLPATGFALNSKVRVNLEFLVDKFNEFNSGTATWDTVAVGTASSLTGAVIFYNSTNGFSVTFQAGVTTASHTYTWPLNDPSVTPSLLLSNTSGVMSWQQILGTSNQVTVTDNANDITFSLPQDIATGSNVNFGNVTSGGNISATGTIAATGNASGARFLAGDGSVTLPSISLSSEASGFYLSTAGVLTWTIAAVVTGLNISANGLVHGPVGTSATYPIEVTRADNTDSIIAVRNTATASTAGDAILLLEVNDSGNTNDPVVKWDADSTFWTAGVDSSDGNSFVIGNSTNLGTNVFLKSTTGGATSILNGGNTLVTFDTTGATFVAGDVVVLTGATTGTVTIAPSASITSWTLTLPTTNGNSNEFLKTDGNGVTSWDSIGGGGGATTALDNLASVQVNDHIIPDTDDTYDFGSSLLIWQTVRGQKIFAGRNTVAGQILLYPATDAKGFTSFTASNNAGNTTTTINTAAQAGARTYTVPDAGASTASFMMTEGAQTVVGAQTFSAAAIFSSTITPTGGFTSSLVSDSDGSDNLGTDAISWGQLHLKGSIKYGSVTCASMNSIGAVTQPNQPSFLATADANTLNVTGDGTNFTIEYNTEIKDFNADYNTTTFTFTAPITGLYFVSASVRLTGIASNHTLAALSLILSNGTHDGADEQVEQGGNNFASVDISMLADMDANDTVSVRLSVSGGSKVVEVRDETRGRNQFSCSLIN